MSEYALISNGVVASVMVADASFIDANFPGAVQVDQLTPRPGIGWTYAAGEFTAPAAPTPSNPVFTSVEFMNLFTATELQAILNCQSNITLTTDQKQKMNIFIGYFQAASAAGVDMTMTPTIQGLELCESCGLINTGRAAQILATRH